METGLSQLKDAVEKCADIKIRDIYEEVADECAKTENILYKVGNNNDKLMNIQDEVENNCEKPEDMRNYSPLTLAYIGDAVYELLVRTIVVRHANAPVNKLHKRSAQLVKAPAQAWMAKAIEPLLNEEEKHVLKRGRNAKAHTKAKNASIIDYRTATGFEALVGYLYLQKNYERMTALVGIAIEKYSEEMKGV